jgi:hypothetical protein
MPVLVVPAVLAVRRVPDRMPPMVVPAVPVLSVVLPVPVRSALRVRRGRRGHATVLMVASVVSAVAAAMVVSAAPVGLGPMAVPRV